MQSNPCEKWKPLLIASACGDLQRREEASLREHLQSCPSCARERACLEQILLAAREMPQPSQPPQAFWDHLPSRIVEKIQSTERPLQSFFLSHRALIAASVLFLACAALWGRQRNLKDKRIPSSSSKVQRVGNGVISSTLEERLAQLEEKQLDDIYSCLETEIPALMIPACDSLVHGEELQKNIYTCLPPEWDHFLHTAPSPFSWPSVLEYDVQNLSDTEREALINELNSFMT